jgi:large subunit ribosomal protein L21
MTYAIVKTGGKQYRVEQGQSLLVERLSAKEGDKVALEPLFLRDGDNLVDGDDLAKATVSAKVVAHERGPKIRVLKFKPKRGYKRRSGHRQGLTRLEVTEIKLGTRRASTSRKPAAGSADVADKPRARRSSARKPPAGKES